MSIRPIDIIADGSDSISINGTEVRKGTVGAFLANICLLENEDVPEQQKKEAIETMIELAPSLVAVGLHHHVTFKNEHAQKILNNAARAGLFS